MVDTTQTSVIRISLMASNAVTVSPRKRVHEPDILSVEVKSQEKEASTPENRGKMSNAFSTFSLAQRRHEQAKKAKRTRRKVAFCECPGECDIRCVYKCELHKVKTEDLYLPEDSPDKVVEQIDEPPKSKENPIVATTRAQTVAIVIKSPDPLLEVRVITNYEDRCPQKASVIERQYDAWNKKYLYYLSVQEKSTPRQDAGECTWSSDDEWDPKKMPNMEI